MITIVSNSKERDLGSPKAIKENDLQINSLSSQPLPDPLVTTAKKAEELKEQALIEFSERNLSNSIKLCEEALKFDFNDTSLKTSILSDLVTYQISLASQPPSSTEEEERLGKSIENSISKIDNQTVLDGIAFVLDTVLPTLSPTVKGMLLNQRGLMHQKKGEIEKAQKCFLDVFPLKISNSGLKTQVLNNLLSLVETLDFSKSKPLFITTYKNFVQLDELKLSIADHPLKTCPELRAKFQQLCSRMFCANREFDKAIAYCRSALALPFNNTSLKEQITNDLLKCLSSKAALSLSNALELSKCITLIQSLTPPIQRYILDEGKKKQTMMSLLFMEAKLYLHEGVMFSRLHSNKAAFGLLTEALTLEGNDTPLKTAIKSLKDQVETSLFGTKTTTPSQTPNLLEHLFY